MSAYVIDSNSSLGWAIALHSIITIIDSPLWRWNLWVCFISSISVYIVTHNWLKETIIDFADCRMAEWRSDAKWKHLVVDRCNAVFCSSSSSNVLAAYQIYNSVRHVHAALSLLRRYIVDHTILLVLHEKWFCNHDRNNNKNPILFFFILFCFCRALDLDTITRAAFVACAHSHSRSRLIQPTNSNENVYSVSKTIEIPHTHIVVAIVVVVCTCAVHFIVIQPTAKKNRFAAY